VEEKLIFSPTRIVIAVPLYMYIGGLSQRADKYVFGTPQAKNFAISFSATL
jgi:hypothetical protein